MKNLDRNNIKNNLKNYFNLILKKEPQDSDLNFWLEKIFLKGIELSSIKKHFEYLISLKGVETNYNNKRQFSLKSQEEYAHNKFKEIQGWLNPESAVIISSLSKIQNEIGIMGSVGEIGVHHGKLFILLHLMLNKGERSFCVDVFERQDLNVDKSGHGSYEIFNKNIKKYGSSELVDIFSDSSLNLLSSDVISKSGKARILSIDGGHTPEVVVNDFQLGESMLVKGGIIILDDYFNAAWPGVSEGTNEYFLGKKSRLRPFAISPNKVFFTNDKEISIQYFNFFKTVFLDKFLKSTKMYGYDVIVLRGQQ